LDGEKNLKTRKIPKGLNLTETFTQDETEKYPYILGSIKCDLPNANLYEFKGHVILTKENEMTMEYSLNEN
jgi:hypothetical protein